MSAVELEDARAAALGSAEKGAYVRGMFSAIAPRYDLLNHVLSLNLDRSWRRRAIAALEISRRPSARYLDVCAGTLDVAAAIARVPGFTGSVVGADFSEGMLRAGAGKPTANGERRTANGEPKDRTGRVSAVAADALLLPLPDACCAGAIVAFGIRNVADLDAALREAFRVLEPDSRFVILEFTTPRNALVRAGYHAYFHRVLPRIGAWVSGHTSAYTYLPVSVAHFPDEAALAVRMAGAGFRDVRWETLMFGVVAIHVGVR